MKKSAIVLVVLILTLTLCACEETEYVPPCNAQHPAIVTDKPEGYIYKLEEPINLFYEGNDAKVGSLVVYNAVVLREGSVHVLTRENKDVVDAVVQINYRFYGINCLNSWNFSFTDHQGTEGHYLPKEENLFAQEMPDGRFQFLPSYTEYDVLQCGVFSKGEYLYVDLTDCHGNFVARIQAYYNGGEDEISPAEVMWIIALTLTALFVLLYWLSRRKRKKSLQMQPVPDADVPVSEETSSADAQMSQVIAAPSVKVHDFVWISFFVLIIEAFIGLFAAAFALRQMQDFASVREFVLYGSGNYGLRLPAMGVIFAFLGRRHTEKYRAFAIVLTIIHCFHALNSVLFWLANI